MSAEESVQARAVADEGIPPEDPTELLQQASFPEGKPRLSDPPDFAQEVGISEIKRRAPRLARALAQPVEELSSPRDYASLVARNPVVRAVLRWMPGLRNPHLFAENGVQKAALIRAALIDDGRQKIVGLQAHARQFGNQNDLFGRTDDATGLLTQKEFKGHSVNEVAENPSQFKLTTQQSQWIDEMASLEREILNLYRRNDISVSELPLVEVERYAGRVHVARVLSDGSIIERGFAGSGPGRLSGRTGAEQQRVFATVKQAQEEGFIPLSYEESFTARAQSAYNRVVNKETAEWVQQNLPTEVKLRTARPGEPLQFGERITNAFTGFPGLRVEGIGTQQFLRDLEGMFPGAESSFLRGINSVNAVQRIFALAGDASLATIQFIILAARHPIRFGRAMGEFSESLIRSTMNPRTNRARRAKFLTDNAELIQRAPGLILSDSGLEFTEALARGGFLSPEGLYKGANPLLRGVSRVPGALSSPLRPFQQAFESVMDNAGVNLYKGLEHLTEGDPLRTRELVDYVNNMRGLSSSARLGLTPNQRLVESSILLAPRYRRAVAALHASLIQGGLKGSLARQAYVTLTAGVVSTYIGISFALGAAEGKSKDQILKGIKFGLDPSKKQFLLWKTGTTAFGLGSKMTSDLRMLARIATDPGDVADFSDFNRNIGVRWVRSQLAAAPSTAWDLLVGQDYLGEPITRDFSDRPLDTLKSLGKMVGENVTPLWVQAAAFEGGDKEERTIKGGSDFLGMRSHPFPGPSYDDVAQALYGMDYDELALPNSRFPSKAQNQVREEWERLLSDERRQEREEGADKRTADRKKLERGIQLLPGARENLRKLEQQFAP